MPYSINRFNGSTGPVVADGTIDNTYDVKLIGKNYAGYGEIQNENFIFLLENFSNTSPPPRPISGQIWFDAAANKLKFYDKLNNWRTTGGAEVGDTPPLNLSVGDFWYNTASKQLFAWDSELSDFVLIGPQGVESKDTTEMQSVGVFDINGTLHAIIIARVDGDVVFSISTDVEFELRADEISKYPGFTIIRQGLTLRNTNGSPIGRTLTADRWWGTASDSDRLGGIPADQFLRTGDLTFSGIVRFPDTGYIVGSLPRDYLKVFIDNTVPTIKTFDSSILRFKTTVNSVEKFPLEINGENVLPGADNATELGSTVKKFKIVNAYIFNGTATQADKLKVGSAYQEANTGSVANTVVARDSSSDIRCNVLHGTATQANYADLAEKYLTDIQYDIGTVVMVGGEKEVTAAQSGRRAIGVVSENPAYMMNSELEGGTYIALKGRVPVKVYGMVKKGAELEAGANGVAVVADPESTKVFAIALENNSDPDVKFVECVIL